MDRPKIAMLSDSYTQYLLLSRTDRVTIKTPANVQTESFTSYVKAETCVHMNPVAVS